MNNVVKSFLEEAITNRDLVEQLISQITFEENKLQDKLLKIMLPKELIKVVDFLNFSQDIEKGNSEKNTKKIKI